MKLSRTDGVPIIAIACGALTAVGLTSLVAVSGGHERTHVHIHHVEHVDEVRHKEVRVRIETRQHADDQVEVTVVPADAPSVEVERDVSSGPQPLIYVDGVRMEGDREVVLAGIDPDRIDRVEVVKGEAAMRLFGDEATGGVIQIYLKEIGAAHPGG